MAALGGQMRPGLHLAAMEWGWNPPVLLDLSHWPVISGFFVSIIVYSGGMLAYFWANWASQNGVFAGSGLRMIPCNFYM